MNRRPTKTQKTLAASRAQRGLDRKAHFAAGGTVAAWRGVHTCTKNGKAYASKNACRRPARADD